MQRSMRPAAGAARNGAMGAPKTKPAAAAAPKPHGKPSDRLTQKTADPFAPKNKQKTNFGVVYVAGGIPCTINHGSIKNRLQWKNPPETLDYNPLVIKCAEGLCETEFPFVFVARTAFKELLEADGGPEKVMPHVAKIIPSLRAAVVTQDTSVYEAGLEAILQMSKAVGPAMNPHLGTLLTQINRRNGNKAKISECLEALEINGGDDALRQIKAKIPTYMSVN